MDKKDIHTPHFLSHIRMDKTGFSVTILSEKTNERDYWLSKTPQERMQALELMRQINYGYDPTTARLQRVLEIVELAPDYFNPSCYISPVGGFPNPD